MRLSLIFDVFFICLGAALIVAPLATGWWEPLVHPLIYDAAGHLKPAGMGRSVGIFLFQYLYDHVETWPLGVALFLAGLWHLALRRIPWSANRMTKIAQTVGALTTCASVLVTAPLVLLGEGASIRPLGWLALVLPTAAVGVLAAIFAGLPAMLREAPKAPAVAGFLLCLAPFPVALMTLGLLIQMMQLQIES